MPVTRAPVRVSFAGGGTDLPDFYERNRGFVVSTAINRYVYARTRAPSSGATHLTSINLDARATYRPGQRPAVVGRLAYLAAVVEHFWEHGVRGRGIDLAIVSEIEPGTGLGSSSAVLVAAVSSVAEYCGLHLSPGKSRKPPANWRSDGSGNRLANRINMPAHVVASTPSPFAATA